MESLGVTIKKKTTLQYFLSLTEYFLPWLLDLWMKSWSVTIAIKNVSASLAQWLEHWSCKPGVESSNLSRGYSCFSFYASIGLGFSYPTKWQSTLAVKLFLHSWLVANLFSPPSIFYLLFLLQLTTLKWELLNSTFLWYCLVCCTRQFYFLRLWANPCVTIQMKATEQYFPMVLFIMLYKVFFNFQVDGWNLKVWPFKWELLHCLKHCKFRSKNCKDLTTKLSQPR